MVAVPYPADTRSKGWRFELDLEQIEQSDTWALAPQELRPWLLMLWSVSWKQLPCGSLPNDDGIIAARIGMKPSSFKKAREVLLRGWWLAEDGRLYHPTITQRVLAMLATKQKEKDRKAAYRTKMAADVPRDNHGTTTGQTRTDIGVPPEETPPVPEPVPEPVPVVNQRKSEPSSSTPSREREATTYQTFQQPGEWLNWFNREYGTEINPSSVHDRKPFWQLATGWCSAGVTTGQMRAAIEKAQAEAKEPIAYLPAYADRVLKSLSAPPRASPPTLAEQNRAASEEAKRLLFGTGSGEQNHATVGL